MNLNSDPHNTAMQKGMTHIVLVINHEYISGKWITLQ